MQTAARIRANSKIIVGFPDSNYLPANLTTSAATKYWLKYYIQSLVCLEASHAQEEESHRAQFYALFSFCMRLYHFNHEEVVQEYNRIPIL